MNRPTSVTVLGIINLVFAAWGFLGVAMVVAMDFMPMPANAKNPMLDLMQQNAVYAIYTKVSLMLGIVATIVLGLAGIGLLMMRPWGRWLSIGYAIYGILSVIIGAVLFYTFLLGPLLAKEAASSARPGEGGNQRGNSRRSCRHMFWADLSDRPVDFHVSPQRGRGHEGKRSRIISSGCDLL